MELTDLLLEKNITISAAESCTGGLFAKTLTDRSGISAVFEGSVVTYSNRIKHQLLGVKEETLANFGAVSPQTAEEMARGICTLMGSQVGVGITGIAGPDGGTAQKPVGLVYVGLYWTSHQKLSVLELHLFGTRQQIRQQTVETACKALCKLLTEF